MSWMSPIVGTKFDTPTIIERKRVLAERTAKYSFVIDGETLSKVSAIGDAAVIAYAAISGAAFGDRRNDWVTVGRVARELIDRDYKWWYRATEALVEAKLVEVQRRRGQLPRFRLTRQLKGDSS